MKLSVILGHPYSESFNAAIAGVVVQSLLDNGHVVRFHDLYREKFDPLLHGAELARDHGGDALVVEHQREIKEADGIVIIHPNWWGQPPAMLKGWVDRVLRENVAYAFPPEDNGGGLPVGLLKATAALVFNHRPTRPGNRESTAFGDPLERIWKDCIFGFCGVTTVARKMFRVMADSSQAQREAWLGEAIEMTHRFFPGRNG